MMDPITLAFSTLKVAASIGTFLEKRKIRKILQTQQNQQNQQTHPENPRDPLEFHRHDVLLVLGTLGDALLRLGIVDIPAIPAATEEVRRCLQLNTPETKEIFDDDLEPPLQYAVVAGFMFCATCWPMQIYQGFGCSLLNESDWSDDSVQNRMGSDGRTYLTDAKKQARLLSSIDDCIAGLKPSVNRLCLFSKTPSGLSQIAVNKTDSGNQKYKKKARAWLNDVYAEVRKRGPPQPKDKSFQVTEMIIGFATWLPTSTYSNIFGQEDAYYPVRCQGDPGKLLYAYTIGNQLDLQPGQILMPIDRIQHILLTWLEGLEGMTFKLMRDDEFDKKHPKFKKTNRWVFEWNVASDNVVAVRQGVKQRIVVHGRAAHSSAPAIEHTLPAQSTVAAPVTDQPRDKTIAGIVESVNGDSDSLSELFLVLETLGQRLIALGVINNTALPSSHASVCHSISVLAKGLSKAFSDLEMRVQYSITCAVIFCAACYPMHIYRGFGCGVLNNMFWGIHPNDTRHPEIPRSKHLTDMDKVLAHQKSAPDSLRLLKKVPEGVDKDIPLFGCRFDEDAWETCEEFCDDQLSAIEECGFPRPKDARITVKSWDVHFATWQGPVLYETLGHNLHPQAARQSDPGRMLYGWTVWNRLNLRPGQVAWVPADPSASSLAAWLEGLEGMTFKLLRDEELDYSHITYSERLSQAWWEHTGNAHGLDGTPSIVVLDPESLGTSTVNLGSPRFNPESGSDVASTRSFQSSASTAVETQKIRRPPPPPPQKPTNTPKARVAKAKYDFESRTPEELSFLAGEVLQIVNKEHNDGWWTAQGSRGVGLIPSSYVDCSY